MRLSYDKIQLVMAEKKLSYGEVASRAGIAKPTLSINLKRIREGVNTQPKTAAAIARGLGVRVKTILVGEAA